jgi:hypothetical protein
LEPALQFAILAKRSGRLALGQQQADRLAMSLLTGRAARNGTPGVLERCIYCSLLLVQVHKYKKCVKETPSQALLLGRDPCVVVTGQQRATVTLHGAGQVLHPFGNSNNRAPLGLSRLAQRLLEGFHVGGESAGIQLDREAIGDQDGSRRHSGRLELVAQRRKRVGKVVATFVRGHVGPEQIDQDLAGVAMAFMVGQVRQQRARALGAKASDRAGCSSCLPRSAC